MDAVFDQRRYLIPFRATLLPQIFTDVLVIGAGVAGTRAALSAAQFGRDVIVVAKGDVKHSCSHLAQGGIAAVTESGDSFQSHIDDTMDAGAGLCDEPIVSAVVEQAPARIRELIQWGMPFDTVAASVSADALTGDAGHSLALGREGGHSVSRVLHAAGDATGRVLMDTLERAVAANARIRLFENCFVLDLITIGERSPRCVGAITHHARHGLQVIWATATILASGGCGQVYRESTNPSVATGDGLAMAYRAGAQLADMSFMQFHPTTLYVAGAARSLITEAVRGEGAHLIDRNGVRFMPDYHPMAELAPRDIVARAILAQVAKTNFTHVFLDCRSIGEEQFTQRFPGITKLLEQFDINPGEDPIPIRPSAHYMIGGIRTDGQGRTNINGLYACGEVACTGLHGANRLASNSLLEGLVIGDSCGRTCDEMFDEANSSGGVSSFKIISDIRPSDRSELNVGDVRSSLRSVMWRHVGIARDGQRLAEVTEMFDFWARYTLDKIFDDRQDWEVQNLLLIGALIIRSARWRAESRGTHYRVDCPTTEGSYCVHDLWQRDSTEPKQQAIQQGTETGTT